VGRAGQPAAQYHQMRAAQDHEMEGIPGSGLGPGPCLLAAALRVRPIRAVRVAPGPALGPGSTPLAGRLVTCVAQCPEVACQGRDRGR
jgi:hypothetical protein